MPKSIKDAAMTIIKPKISKLRFSSSIGKIHNSRSHFANLQATATRGSSTFGQQKEKNALIQTIVERIFFAFSSMKDVSLEIGGISLVMRRYPNFCIWPCKILRKSGPYLKPRRFK